MAVPAERTARVTRDRLRQHVLRAVRSEPNPTSSARTVSPIVAWASGSMVTAD
jgi:hypothetical protein